LRITCCTVVEMLNEPDFAQSLADFHESINRTKFVLAKMRRTIYGGELMAKSPFEGKPCRCAASGGDHYHMGDDGLVIRIRGNTWRARILFRNHWNVLGAFASATQAKEAVLEARAKIKRGAMA